MPGAKTRPTRLKGPASIKKHIPTRMTLVIVSASLSRAVSDRAHGYPPLGALSQATLRAADKSFLEKKDGRAGRLPQGVVKDDAVQLALQFCYVGTLLNIEGEWRERCRSDAQARVPDDADLQVSLTGGEIFMRKDILDVLQTFKDKDYVCGYLTTNGNIISDERADAWPSCRRRVPVTHQRLDRRPGPAARQSTRGERHVRAHVGGPAAAQDAARKAPLRSASTPLSRTTLDARSMVDVAAELGVDAIGLNHLMFSTPVEVEETVRPPARRMRR